MLKYLKYQDHKLGNKQGSQKDEDLTIDVKTWGIKELK